MSLCGLKYIWSRDAFRANSAEAAMHEVSISLIFPKKHYISDCVKVLKYNLPPKGGPATSVTATHK